MIFTFHPFIILFLLYSIDVSYNKLLNILLKHVFTALNTVQDYSNNLINLNHLEIQNLVLNHPRPHQLVDLINPQRASRILMLL